jgi:hypothetical protein
VTKTGEHEKTGLRIRNKVWLHKNLPENMSYDLKAFEIYCIFIPNHERIYGNFWAWFVAEQEYRDKFDDKLIKVELGMGVYWSKLKEISDGLWMLRTPDGVCYFIEPKCAMTRESLKEELIF